MSSIQIEQQMGSIGINHTRAQININVKHPQVHIHQEQGELSIEQQRTEIRINNTKPNAATGRRKPVEFTAYNVQKSKRAVEAGLKRTAGEANYVGDVTKQGTNRIAQNAQSLARELGTTEVHIDAVDMGPELEWEPGYVQVNWSPNSVSLEVDGEFYPDIYVNPTHSLEIYLQEEPYLKITMVEDALPPATGRRVNENI